MNLFRLTSTSPITTKSMNCSPLRRAFVLFPLMLACFTLSPTAQAQLPSPSPDGGYPNDNTAEGSNALFSVTTGSANTAVGGAALFGDTTGFGNTAIGDFALATNTTGNENTAVGAGALLANTNVQNTAVGNGALLFNTTGFENTATGFNALRSNPEIGGTGELNTADGAFALSSNTTGFTNTAIGVGALGSNTTGNNNIALGGGINLTTGSNNIDIGNPGVAAEANTIRIGVQGAQTATFIAGINGTAVTGVAVKVNAAGQLGVPPSAARFKDDIKPMNEASEAILGLKPVTFRYKKEIDPERALQFGLVAEDVAKMNRDLVARDAKGALYTVRYEAVNAMLLNEFLKEHRTVQELKSTVAKQEATIAQQQKGMEALTATVKEQAAQIQKVSAQLEVSKSTPQTVANSQ